MPAGELLTAADRFTVDEAIRQAEQLCRFEFSVFVGPADGDTRAFATRLHNSLVAPTRSVLVMVDPAARALEIVTGSEVRRHLRDQETELAALHMQSFFVEGDLVGGLSHGIRMLADHARAPEMLHTDQA